MIAVSASERSGISIGEAAGFALLEREGSGLALLGAGASSDGHHMSSPHPEGAGAVAAMAAAARGVDVVVFTGGVGERSAPVRTGAAQRLDWLGVRVDAERNAAADGPDAAEIGATGAPVRVFVLTAREDLQIAHEVRQLLGA